MSQTVTIPDDAVERMLRNRAARGDATGLLDQARAAVGATHRPHGLLGAATRWLPPAASVTPRPSMAGIALILVVGLIGAGLLGRFGQSGAGSSPASASPSPTPASTSSSDDSSFRDPIPAGDLAPASFWPALTMTLPAGWRGDGASEMYVGLLPDTAENVAQSAAGFPPASLLHLYRNVSAADAGCFEEPATGVGTTARDIVGELAARPGLETSEPVPVSIGGLSGQQVDISVAPDWTETCPQISWHRGPVPFVPLLWGGFLYGAEPGERWRIIVLDVAPLPDGMFATVTVVVYSRSAADWDENLARSMEVIETFDFDVRSPVP